MKNVVRALATAFALTGIFATTQASLRPTKPVITKFVSMQVPTCPPSTPKCCGSCPNSD